MNKSILAILSGITLFGVSGALAFLGRPTEMGLAILAGAIGFAFSNIDKISRFKGAGFEAEMREQQVAESVVTAQTENTESLKSIAFDIDERRQSIMSSLLHTDYNSRYVGGISADTGYSKEIIEDELDWLFENNLAIKRSGSKGYLWNLTEQGMAVLPIVVFGRTK